MSPPGAAVKSARERVQIVSAYHELGSYRAAAKLCGTTHKTVRRVVERQRAGGLPPPRKERPKNTDGIAELVAERVGATDGRISAKRLLPAARAAGYEGSARNLRRLVAEAKAAHRRNRRVYRPWVPAPGGHLVIDWTPAAGLQMFGAVLAWCRYRFVRFAADQRRATTLRLIAECLEEIGGVPAWCCRIAWPACARQRSPGWWCRTPTTCALPPITAFALTSARRPTRSPRGWWST
jgi:transposase